MTRRNRSRVEDVPGAGSDREFQYLRNAITINSKALSSELVMQPDLVFRVHMSKATVISARDAQKERLKQVEKEVADRARSRLIEEEDKPKPTVVEIQRTIEVDDQWKEERKQYLELCFRVDKWSALKEAYLSRGIVMHDLSEMYVSEQKSIAGQSVR